MSSEYEDQLALFNDRIAQLEEDLQNKTLYLNRTKHYTETFKLELLEAEEVLNYKIQEQNEIIKHLKT